MTSLRSKARASQPDHRSARPRTKSLDSGSDDSSGSGSIYENNLQTAKRNFNSRPLRERRTMSRNSTRERSPAGQRKETHAHGRHSAENLRGSSEHHHRHRRRRKRSSTESNEGNIYHTTAERGSENAIPRSRHTPSHSVVTEQRRSSAPEHTKVLHTSNSETLQRTRSHRASVTSRHSHERRRSEDLEKGHTAAARESSATKSGLRRSVSSRDSPSKSTSRPGLVRSQSSAHRVRRTSPMPTVKEEPKTQPSRGLRSTSVFGSLFGPPRPQAPEATVECLTCLDDVPISKVAKLSCGHRMCNSCLKRIFTMSVNDPAHMPPKCCTDDCIPLKHAQKLFDDKFKMKWNRKYLEYTTKNRIYCPAKGCGSWIPPKDIKADHSGGPSGGRKYGVCPKCKTQVCATCNGKRHRSRECPKDDTTQRFAEMAKENGWQRCYNCSATVELKEGCNHMTCRCTAQFCMICGSKWKTCNCPWFNYATVQADILAHMNIPQVRLELARGNPILDQPRHYHEELERRREQERQDEEMARRLQRQNFGVFGVGNGAGHFLNEDFVQRVANLPIRDFNLNRIAAEVRGQRRVTDDALRMPPPVAAVADLSSDRPLPDRRPQARAAPAPSPRAPTPPAHPGTSTQSDPQRRPQLRRAATTRAAGVAAYRVGVQPGDVDPIAARPEVQAPRPTPEMNRRSALLAGLNMQSTVGRVDAWRQHISGDAGLSPL